MVALSLLLIFFVQEKGVGLFTKWAESVSGKSTFYLDVIYWLLFHSSYRLYILQICYNSVSSAMRRVSIFYNFTSKSFLKNLKSKIKIKMCIFNHVIKNCLTDLKKSYFLKVFHLIILGWKSDLEPKNFQSQ